jgi:hypothetical protein
LASRSPTTTARWSAAPTAARGPTIGGPTASCSHTARITIERADDHGQKGRRPVADVERGQIEPADRGSGRRSGSSRRTACGRRIAGQRPKRAASESPGCPFAWSGAIGHRGSVVLRAPAAPHVDHDEQEQPHHVDEVPVPRRRLEPEVLARGEVPR